MPTAPSKLPSKFDPRRCNICESPHRTRIEGWILSGTGLDTIVDWCRALEPPCPTDKHSVDDHLDEGHIEIGKQQVVGMLVKFNREAEGIIDQASAGTLGTNNLVKNALTTAMNVRMRTIELLAKAHNVIEQGSPRTVNNSLTMTLPKDVQRRMLTVAVKELDGQDNQTAVGPEGRHDAGQVQEVQSLPQALPPTELVSK